MKVELSFGAAGDRRRGAWCCALNRGRGAAWGRADVEGGGPRAVRDSAPAPDSRMTIRIEKPR